MGPRTGPSNFGSCGFGRPFVSRYAEKIMSRHVGGPRRFTAVLYACRTAGHLVRKMLLHKLDGHSRVQRSRIPQASSCKSARSSDCSIGSGSKYVWKIQPASTPGWLRTSGCRWSKNATSAAWIGWHRFGNRRDKKIAAETWPHSPPGAGSFLSGRPFGVEFGFQRPSRGQLRRHPGLPRTLPARPPRAMSHPAGSSRNAK